LLIFLPVLAMAAAAELQAVFPHLHVDQINAALRRCGGNVDRAVEVLLSAPAPTPPDIRKDPEGWFRFFDRDGNGLERHEVVDAVSQTFNGADRAVVKELVEGLWPMFDTDGSGSISLREFTKRDGLREALLAQMGGSTASARPHQTAAAAPKPVQGLAVGYQPGQPVAQPVPAQVVAAAPAGYRPGAPAAAQPRPVRPGPEAELQEMLPNESPARIREALSRCRGDKAAAAERLLRTPAAPAPVPAWPVAAAAQAGGYPFSAPMPTAPPVGAGRVPKLTGRRRALLVGINYFGTQAQLRGCINDVHNMKGLLVNSFGWPVSCMRTLTDDNPGTMPTRRNIEEAMRWLVAGAQPGDVLFFHYSGHGAQKEDPYGYEEDGMNETILPVDFKTAGMMTDDEMGEIMVKQLPEGVRLTAVMDCCHSGTGLDLPFTWTARGWKEETNPYFSLCDVQMFSGCEDDDTSSDASTAYGAAGGAMTTAFCDVLRSYPGLSYSDLMSQLNQLMRRRGFSQRAQLTSSQQFRFDRPFLLDDIIPNSNPTVGRIFRRKFPPRPRPMQGPLADMLGIGAMVLGGMMVGDLAGGLLGALLS